MSKYLLSRILRSVVSVVIVVAVIMVMIYSLLDKRAIFAADPNYSKKNLNDKKVYEMQQWEQYGYLDYVNYAEFIQELVSSGKLDEETRAKAAVLGKDASDDSDLAAKYVAEFTELYESQGYKVERLEGKVKKGRIYQDGGKPRLYAYKEIPITTRLFDYLKGIFQLDTVSKVENFKNYTIEYVEQEVPVTTPEVEAPDTSDTTEDAETETPDATVDTETPDTTVEDPTVVTPPATEKVMVPVITATEGKRGLEFTWFDPAYGGKKFSPAIMGNGTNHRYLLYFDNEFPFIHQNVLTIRLGTSYSVSKNIDVWDSMTQSQGDQKFASVTYPTGYSENTADNLHTATYAEGSFEISEFNQQRYVNDYTSVVSSRTGLSRMGYSFVIGIISVVMAYLLAVPMGILMALKKDKFIDKLGTFYIVFITAVPSLAYIFMFRAIGGKMGLPTTFDMINPTTLMYVLPIISLALPSVANLMKWLRRYMIDQMNADYVKFARSGGLSEGEIFRKHILKNAIIPIVHGIPGSILGAMTGAIITERVYLVPGVGNVLTEAINKYDNAVIVGVALFYAVLTVTSVIMGDVLMSMMDPRISFTTKER